MQLEIKNSRDGYKGYSKNSLKSGISSKRTGQKSGTTSVDNARTPALGIKSYIENVLRGRGNEQESEGNKVTKDQYSSIESEFNFKNSKNETEVQIKSQKQTSKPKLNNSSNNILSNVSKNSSRQKASSRIPNRQPIGKKIIEKQQEKPPVSHKDMVAKLMENVEKSIVELTNNSAKSDQLSTINSNDVPLNVLAGLNNSGGDKDLNQSHESSLNFESTPGQNIILMTESVNHGVTDSHLNMSYQAKPNKEFIKKNNGSFTNANNNSDDFKKKKKVEKQFENINTNFNKNKNSKDIKSLNDQHNKVNFAEVKKGTAENDILKTESNSKVLIAMSGKEFKNGNILEPDLPNNFMPDDQYYYDKAKALGTIKIKDIAKQEENIEAIFTKDKGLVFKKIKPKKKLAIEKLDLKQIHEQTDVVDLQIETLDRKSRGEKTQSSTYRDSKYPKKSLNIPGKKIDTRVLNRHATTQFYQIPNNTARRCSRRKASKEHDGDPTENLYLQETRRQKLNNEKKKNKLKELRKMNYQFENRLKEDEKVDLKLGLNMLHTDELLDYYKEVISKGRKDFTAHSKYNGVSQENIGHDE